MKRCKANRADGNPCQADAAEGQDLCTFHEPSAAERCAEGRREGGRQRSLRKATLPEDTPGIQIRSAREVCSLLSDTINHVRTGRLDPRVANAVGYLASVMIRAFEVGELEERLAALEGTVRPGRPSGASPFDHDLATNEPRRPA